MTDVVAVGGSPLVALLTALHALRRHEELQVSLVGSAPFAEEAEPFRPASLPAELQALIEPLTVQQWNSFQMFEGGEGSAFEQPLVLVDPLQCRIELEPFAGRLAQRRGSAVEHSRAQGGPSPTQLLQARFAEGLTAPILFARDGDSPETYLQCIPCGGGMTLVRERSLPAGASPLDVCFACETALLAAYAAVEALQKPQLRLEVRFEPLRAG